MATKNNIFSPIPAEMVPQIHALINSSILSVRHEDGAAIYELNIADNKYMEFVRDFVTNDNKNISAIYSISICDEDSGLDEEIACMSASVNRRIWTESEQQIIDIFNACSKRIIQQEMQLLQNRIILMTSEFTHN